MEPMSTSATKTSKAALSNTTYKTCSAHLACVTDLASSNTFSFHGNYSVHRFPKQDLPWKLCTPSPAPPTTPPFCGVFRSSLGVQGLESPPWSSGNAPTAVQPRRICPETAKASRQGRSRSEERRICNALTAAVQHLQQLSITTIEFFLGPRYRPLLQHPQVTTRHVSQYQPGNTADLTCMFNSVARFSSTVVV